MKMEVLSVQNQFQGQFGVIGSTKVKDWTSPLTPPPSHQSHNSSNEDSIDIVDGLHHQYYHSNMASLTTMHHRHRSNHIHLQATTKSRTNRQTSSLTTTATTKTSNTNNYSDTSSNNMIDKNLSSNNTTSNAVNNSGSNSSGTNNPTGGNNHPTTNSNNNNRYNSNIIYMTDDDASVNALSMRLQSELRAAKSQHLACTEVSVPWDLTPRIAAEIIKVSEKEPCGIRGCTIYIEFEDEPNNTRRIASMRVDPNTVPTFELYLTLRQDKSGWTSLLPQFIKNLTRSSTIMISPDFLLTKNKLYHSSSE